MSTILAAVLFGAVLGALFVLLARMQNPWRGNIPSAVSATNSSGNCGWQAFR